MKITNIMKGQIKNILFNMKKKDRVLIVNDGALGDFIHSISFIKKLSFSYRHVTILTSHKYYMPNILNVTYLFSYDLLKHSKFDAVFVINSKQKIKHHNIFYFNAYRSFMKGMGTWKEVHWTEFYNSIYNKYYSSNDLVLRRMKQMEELFLDRKISSVGKNIYIHPGSADLRKNWGLQNYIEIYKSLPKEKVFFILGPDDKELKVILKKNKCKYKISETLSDLEKMASKCKLFIGSDSGVSHFFSLFDCKLISIFTVGCGYTHYPYTKQGVFYFEEKVFEAFYKEGKINRINLEPEEVLKQIDYILQDSNNLCKNFFMSKSLMS